MCIRDRFLIIMKEDFMTVKGRFDRETVKKRNFLRETVPFLDKVNSTHILEGFIYAVKEQTVTKGFQLTVQGHEGDKIYFLEEGICSVEKTVVVRPPENRHEIQEEQQLRKILLTKRQAKKIVFSVCKLEYGAIIGEEVLFDESSKYAYTITVISNEAKLFHVTKKNLEIFFPAGTLQGLRETMEKKEEYRRSLLSALIEKKVDEFVHQFQLKSKLEHLNKLLNFANPTEQMGEVELSRSMSSLMTTNRTMNAVDRSLVSKPSSNPLTRRPSEILE
eukprot:TRINITY_DN19830_c0_g1_i2.p1 TRINITY_DN19830_c0_g1~~TRINITY_DN19830_c0_g1_i2.p1  ORF type:complete len:296 (-),score=75.13 TRINITY_DN19830_c0_g1_i2:496-1323(-)